MTAENVTIQDLLTMLLYWRSKAEDLQSKLDNWGFEDWEDGYADGYEEGYADKQEAIHA